MRFCVSGRQPYSVIKRADEVKFNYNDKDRILDLVEKYPDKTVILDVPGHEGDWKLWQMYSEKFDEFYIALHDLSRVPEFNSAHIKWYWPYPITSYYELNEILALGPSYVALGPPLSFELTNVRKIVGPDIKIRMVCNCARPVHLIANADAPGIKGQFVRPEDVDTYGEIVDVFEFDGVTDELKKEATLLDIYQKKEWPGNLNFLITHLNLDIDNRGILDEFADRRMNCRQRCMAGSSCHFCDTVYTFAEALRKEHLRRKQQVDIDNN